MADDDALGTELARIMSDLKFEQLYFRDQSTGLGLLSDGTVVRFIYEGPRGGGTAFTLRVYEVEIKDERSTAPSMFKAA